MSESKPNKLNLSTGRILLVAGILVTAVAIYEATAVRAAETTSSTSDETERGFKVLIGEDGRREFSNWGPQDSAAVGIAGLTKGLTLGAVDAAPCWADAYAWCTHCFNLCADYCDGSVYKECHCSVVDAAIGGYCSCEAKCLGGATTAAKFETVLTAASAAVLPPIG